VGRNWPGILSDGGLCSWRWWRLGFNYKKLQVVFLELLPNCWDVYLWFVTTQCARLRTLPCRDCVFESRRCHGCLFVNVVCCQVEDFATGRSLVQRSPTECVYVSLSVIRCKNNPLLLQRIDRRGQTEKKEELHNDLNYGNTQSSEQHSCRLLNRQFGGY
jgi:hypothetical protein